MTTGNLADFVQPEQEIERLALLFRGLGDPARIRILSLLAQAGELSCRDVERITGYGPSKVSRHFAYLKQARFVRDRRDGLWVYYSLMPSTGTVRARLDQLLGNLPTFYELLADDAAKVAAGTGQGTTRSEVPRSATPPARPSLQGDSRLQSPKKRVLFLCQSNAARSQMAESFLKKYGADQFDVDSAGLTMGEIHPFTRQVLEEAGIGTSTLRAKGVDEFLGKKIFNYVITLCLEAEEQCPRLFPGVGKILQWPFEDIANAELPDDEKLAKFRIVRNRIEQRVKEWLKD